MLQAMLNKNQEKKKQFSDELWLLEHPSVYTQGLAGLAEHLLKPNKIPVIQTDRGGQITYHGPGQLIAYPLLDLAHHFLKPTQLVRQLEHLVIELLKLWGIQAHNQPGAPGIYVASAKIASIGLRIRHRRCYHGIALNVCMDLTPFDAINPCGLLGLKMTKMQSLAPHVTMDHVKKQFSDGFCKEFGYNQVTMTTQPPPELLLP